VYYRLLPSTTEYYRVLPCTTVYYRVLPCTTVYYRVLPSTTVYYRLLPCTTVYYRLLPCTTVYYRVLPCATVYYRVLPVQSTNTDICLFVFPTFAQYANTAKSIENKPKVNQRVTKRALLKDCCVEMDQLRQDLVSFHALFLCCFISGALLLSYLRHI
jgi:hypothetical protein